MPGTPFTLGITIYDTDGTTVLSDVKVTIRNEATNETQDGNTNSSGQKLFNLTDFTSGWTVGDIISYYVLYQGYEAIASFVSTDTGGTQVTLTLVAVATSSTLRYFTVQEFLDTFQLASYDSDPNNGLKPEIVVRVGEAIEAHIDRILNQRFDDNDGSYTTITDEYLTVNKNDYTYFLDNTPLVTLEKFEININTVDSSEDWKNLAYTQLDACDAITDWVAGTDGAITLNTSNDEVNSGSGCLNITKTAGTQSSVLYSKTISTPVDFTGRTFKVMFYCEDITELKATGSTAVEIRVGTDASNYYSMTFDRNEIGEAGWSTLTLPHNSDDSDASTTGSPDTTTCDYIAINITYAASTTTVTASDMRLDNVRFNDIQDLNVNYDTGRVNISGAVIDLPEPGMNQVKVTYTYGMATVPFDIKRLAILLTARGFGNQAVRKLQIDVAETAGGFGEAGNYAFDKEIDSIIENRRFPPIEEI